MVEISIFSVDPPGRMFLRVPWIVSYAAMLSKAGASLDAFSEVFYSTAVVYADE